ncbi:hypothetical protein Taro_022127 [Colocasia esculenta]|uniref:Uncharacterized protein n=1 Tax=Colocasia esculenta TaxID=4460 RepID=A0A843V4H0_COLES|nr:hypothetical protein [Colocasia esculenta]
MVGAEDEAIFCRGGRRAVGAVSICGERGDWRKTAATAICGERRCGGHLLPQLKKTARRRRGYLAVVEIGSSRGTCARFYSFIKAFLFLSVAMLGFEVMAYFKGWHLGVPELQRILAYRPVGVRGVFDWLYSSWVMVRVQYLAPPL